MALLHVAPAPGFRRRRRLLLGAGLVLAAGVASAGAYEDFFRAIDTDNAAGVTELLSRGFDPNTPDEKGHLPLYLALRAEAWQAAQALLAHPQLKVDATNPWGETALMMAALRGRIDWVRKLAERGAKFDKDGWNPLHYAASGPETALIGLLLDRGARIDAAAPNGNTALMMAAMYGAEASVQALLDRGADAKLRNQQGRTAADFARQAGRTGLAERLEVLAR